MMRRPIEDDFDRRWAAAGASPKLRAEIRREAARDPCVSSRAREEAWRSIVRSEERIGWPFFACACALASAAALASGILIFWTDEPGGVPPTAAGNDVVRIARSPEGEVHQSPAGEWIVDAGTIYVEAGHRSAGQAPLCFRAGDLAIEVVGTIFALGVGPDGGVLRVYEGAVVVERDGDDAVTIDPASGVVPAGRRFAPDDEAAQRAWATAAIARRAKKTIAPPSPPTDPASASAHANEEEAVEIEPHHEARTVVRHATKRRMRTAPHAHLDNDRRAAPADTEAMAPEPPSSLSKADASTPLWPAPSRDAHAERTDSEIVRYREARMLLIQGHPNAAVGAFERYLADYPHGLLRDEAEISLLEALHASRSAVFLGEAARWLDSHADHPRAKEIRTLVERAAQHRSKVSRAGANER